MKKKSTRNILFKIVTVLLFGVHTYSTDMRVVADALILHKTLIEVDNSSTFIYIAAGTFEMGYTYDEYLALCRTLTAHITFGEPCGTYRRWRNLIVTPRHVAVRAFYLDQYEVSVTAYANCVNAGVCSTTPLRYRRVADANVPIDSITPAEAETYCTWRNARLPTEAEWEYAARGPQSFTFPWGDEFDGERTNFCDASCWNSIAHPDWNDGYADLASVLAFEEDRSWIGVQNLGGNVAEWTSTRIELDSDDNIYRVVKGGSSITYAHFVAGWLRIAVQETSRQNYVGFRCAQSIEDDVTHSVT